MTTSSDFPRTWFITGVSSGFGRHLTEQALARGERVVGTARKPAALDDLKARYGDQFRLDTLDVTDAPAIRRVVDGAFAACRRIDVVVNNAGYALLGAAEEVSDEQIVHQLNTNLVGSIQVVRAALPHLRAQGGGRIVQISSVGGQIGVPGLSLYHVTKWGIEGFLEATALDVAPFNIQVTIVEPGGARTQVFSKGSATYGESLPAYVGTPADNTRRFIEGGVYQPPGDPAKMARAIIASMDEPQAPPRLVLGSNAYTQIHAALSGRLAALEAQREIACSTEADVPAEVGASQPGSLAFTTP